MNSNEQPDSLDLYRNSLVKAWGQTDYNDWPVKLNSVFHLFLREFGEEVLADLNHLEQGKGWTLAEIAALFRNPARIYRIIDSVIYSMRRRGFALARQREEVLRLLSMVKALKHGSAFNEDGRNIIYSPAQVEHLAGRFLSAPRCDPSEAALVHRFCGLLWAYTETIFFRAHDVTKEIHGPYRLSSSGTSLVVKEYLNLCPEEVWPGTVLLGHPEIRVFLHYTDELNIEIDALNHVYIHGKGRPVQHLLAFEVEIGDRRATSDEIRGLMDKLSTIVVGNTKHVDNLSWHQKVEKYAEIFWFRKSPLRKARGLDWRLPPQVREQILAGSPNPLRIPRLSPEEVRRLARLTI